MKPQPRHIEAARDAIRRAGCVEIWSHDFHKLASSFADALADAENRAAWDGWDRHRNWAKAFWAQAYGDTSIVLSSMEERYGPRPTDAAKEVGNE